MKRLIYFICFCLLFLSLINLADAHENYPQINASDILKQIESGQDVYIERKIIEGNLNLSEANLEVNQDGLKVVKGGIEIDECIVKEIDFSNSLLKDEVVFANSDFHKLNFVNSHFSKKVRIYGSNLTYSNFTNTVFEGRTIFIDDHFFEAEFDGANFNSVAVFERNEFIWSSLINIVFDNETYFYNTVFKGFYELNDCIFNKDVSFQNVNVGSHANFENNTFKGNASFYRLEATNSIYFMDTSFAKKMRFNSDLSQTDVQFADITFSGEADFSRSKFENIYFYYTDFNSDVIFSEMDYERMYVNWDEIKDKLVFDGPAYLKLRQNFVFYEKYTDADDVYYAYQVERRKRNEEQNIFIKFVEWFLFDITCGYGVKPLNTLMFSVGVMLFFGGIYASPVNFTTLKREKNKTLDFWHLKEAFIFSLGVFTQSGYKNDDLEYMNHRLIMIEKIIGWFTLTLLVITLTNTMIRF